MKGYEIYKRVINLLGYVNQDDSISADNALYRRALYAFNQILVDLKQDEVKDLNCEINIPKASMEALVYGVAMVLSLIGCDAELNRVFTQIYNSKRSAALSESATVVDVLPTVIEGEG
jgi:hypothetical protein